MIVGSRLSGFATEFCFQELTSGPGGCCGGLVPGGRVLTAAGSLTLALSVVYRSHLGSSQLFSRRVSPRLSFQSLLGPLIIRTGGRGGQHRSREEYHQLIHLLLLIISIRSGHAHSPQRPQQSRALGRALRRTRSEPYSGA